MKRGKFITIEGNEGVGKSTQTALLARRLQAAGYKTRIVHEPGSTPIGEAIRDLIKDPVVGRGMCYETELFLFQAARAQLVRDVIIPALNNGEIVLADRFTDSTMVYQGYVRGISPIVIETTTELVTMDAKPDLTIVIQAPLELTLQRVRARKGQDRLEQEGASFMNAVHDGFETLIETDPGRIQVVDGTKSVEAVAQEIWQLTIKKLELN